jgi:hypothetical protein
MFAICMKQPNNTLKISTLGPFRSPQLAGQEICKRVKPTNRSKYIVRRLSDDEIADAHYDAYCRDNGIMEGL